MPYYDDKVADLKRLFGARQVAVEDRAVQIDDGQYDVVDDVIIALPEERRPGASSAPTGSREFAVDVQSTFGREWEAFSEILPEHRQEFEAYFDLVDLRSLTGALVGDLGCGMGRHSWFLARACRRVALVDFSDAIFVARRNFREVPAIFVMADIARLPFADDAFDFAFSLGVLHHLPCDALAALRTLRPLAPRLLVYLYYALDNRPAHFRVLLRGATALRRRTARITDPRVRSVLTTAIAYGIYAPLVRIGGASARLERLVPLADSYAGKSMRRIRQDVYDRFFTGIEQRVTRRQIEGLRDTFSSVKVSDSWPYWHFLCER